jgi:hypothetical protein
MVVLPGFSSAESIAVQPLFLTNLSRIDNEPGCRP